MAEAVELTVLRARILRHSAAEFFGGSKLRVAVIVSLAVLFWALMFAMFLEVFIFLAKFRAISDILIDYLFAFFFLALLVMMTISNAIIGYSSMFRSEESQFLLTLPARAESIFTYKGLESVVFSSWGMVTLVVPMILAYGLVMTVPWYFFPFSMVLALVFVALPTEIGALCALLVTVLVPRRRKTVLILGAAVAFAAGALWTISIILNRPDDLFSEAGIKSVVDRIAFCQHWALPSHWVSEGMLAAAGGEVKRACFLTLMLLSNAMFLGYVVHQFGCHLYRRAWGMAQDKPTRNTYGLAALADSAFSALVSFVPAKLRLLLLKDFRTFRRDAAQWSQCLLFFGLLALYILNIPHFGLAKLGPYWHNLVGLLNLGATCLTLSTFTSRFIFPQLSLEGRRFWILGLLPLERSAILWGKFIFACLGSLLFSGTLILLSDLMLGLGGRVILIHAVVVVCVCCGLNGLAVGLGAVYPNMRSDSPSKIVSSFGGTLNLVCSICYLGISLGLVAVPLHLNSVGYLDGAAFRWAIGLGLAAELAAALAATLIPMAAGVRSFRKMEF